MMLSMVAALEELSMVSNVDSATVDVNQGQFVFVSNGQMRENSSEQSRISLRVTWMIEKIRWSCSLDRSQ